MATTAGGQEPDVTSSLGGDVVSIVKQQDLPALPTLPKLDAKAMRPTDLAAMGKRFATGSRAGSDVTVTYAHGIDTALAFAEGKASTTDDEDACENGRGYDRSSAKWKACLAEMPSGPRLTFGISANCTMGTVQFMNGPWFLLPDRSKTKSADCQAPSFWILEGQRKEVPWQEIIRLNSAFRVLCPTKSREWFLADKRC